MIGIMSRLTRTSLMLAAFIGLDKILAFIRQVVIARQFGLSTELDAFNVANNLPDMLYALISGGALSIAFIPVLSEVLTQLGKKDLWKLFSRIVNLTFIITGLFSILIALMSEPLVSWRLGIAPGFNQVQQSLVAQLMRLNLIGTLIFSISGLVMAGLQANQHFLFPALAPPLYNVGQIIGALILSPEKGYTIAGFTLPAFGLGVHGLVYGVIIGALLHLGIQIPGLLIHRFRWSFSLGLKNEWVKKTLSLFGPRLLTVFCIQLIFLVRDNLASRLEPGSVTALTYGWMIQQVPETLIGTALGIAILPTLSEFAAQHNWQALRDTLERAIHVILALTIPISAILMVTLKPLLANIFNFGDAGTNLLAWVTRGFLLGLIGHSLLEVVNRSYYARQNVKIPLLGAVFNVTLYILLGSLLFRRLDAPGISLTDSIVYTIQVILLIIVLNKIYGMRVSTLPALWNALFAGFAGAAVAMISLMLLQNIITPFLAGLIALILGVVAVLPFIRRELKLLVKL